MRKLRPKEVQDHTARKWWSRHGFGACVSRHHWGSEKFPDNSGWRSQDGQPGHFQRLPALWPLGSAAPHSLLEAGPFAHCPWNISLPRITLFANICCWSFFFTTDPGQTAYTRPCRLLPQDPPLGRVIPSLLLPPSCPIWISLLIFTSSHPELQLDTCSSGRGGGPRWPGATRCRTQNSHWLSQSVVSFMWLNSFFRYFFILSAQLKTVNSLRTRTKPCTYFLFSRIFSPGPHNTVKSIIYDWVRIKS